MLPDRKAATLAEWLREHPGAEIVCRDGSAAYAESDPPKRSAGAHRPRCRSATAGTYGTDWAGRSKRPSSRTAAAGALARASRPGLSTSELGPGTRPGTNCSIEA